MKKCFLFLMFIFSSSLFGAEVIDSLTSKLTFTVKDFKSKKEIYLGKEDISLANNIVEKKTFYYDLKDNLIQKEIVSYTSDKLVLINYTLENLINGQKIKVVNTKGKLAIEYKKNKETEVQKNDQLTWNNDTAHGKVIHHMIYRNWKNLTSKKNVEFDILVPYRLDKYGFRIAYESKANESIRFKMEPNSWLLRNLVEPMYFIYNESNKRMEKYIGVTTVSSDSEDRIIEIDFNYKS